MSLFEQLSNSMNRQEFNIYARELETHTNQSFMGYFNRIMRKKDKWAFCFMNEDQRKLRTNMNLESWHKTLKYYYFNGKRNYRVDHLIYMLLKMDDDTKYSIKLHHEKGSLANYNRKTNSRHEISLKARMNRIDQEKVQVMPCYLLL